MDFTKKQPQDWSHQNIANFWDWQSKDALRSTNYFTAVMAGGIVRFLRSRDMIKGKLLDYGCGSGHLLEQLAKENNAAYYGLDFSSDSVDEAKERTKSNTNVKAVVLVDRLPSPFENDTFDTITFIETIEHLQDDMLDETMKELYRILKPGGKLLITTPFNEDLEKHFTFCPFCRSAFHHMQHMQSFTIERLNKLLQQYSFNVTCCNNIDIEKWKLGSFKFFIKKSILSLATYFNLKEKRSETAPNLIAIASKPL